MLSPIMENQMEKKIEMENEMENEMEAGIIMRFHIPCMIIV